MANANVEVLENEAVWSHSIASLISDELLERQTVLSRSIHGANIFFSSAEVGFNPFSRLFLVGWADGRAGMEGSCEIVT